MKYILNYILFINSLILLKIITCSKSLYNDVNFPTQYLEPDIIIPSYRDLDHFILMLKKTAYINTKSPNNTDSNIAIATYLMTCILRRTLLDDGIKLTKFQYNTVFHLLKKGQNYVSHYIYNNKPYGYKDMEHRVSVLYKDVDIFAYFMNTFKEKRLSKWILKDFPMHSYIYPMDKATLAKEEFIKIVEKMDKYHISLADSDLCLSRIMETSEPLNSNQMKPCREDDYCRLRLSSGPSIAYSLSHRLLNMVFRRNVRRCYIESVKRDAEMNNQLCAFMYKEAVYLARRGYFIRDLFLEHVALCGIMGYREFYRMHWFYKVTSWMDDIGCIQENPNYDINRTRLYKDRTNSTKKKQSYTKSLKYLLLNDCHSHPMSLLMVVLANAVRYVVHFV